MLTILLQLPGQPEPASRLPDALDRVWGSLTSAGALERLLILFLIGAALYALSRLIRRAINAHIEDVNQRHQLRKVITYLFWVALVMAAVTLFIERSALADIGTILGLLAAAVTIALADVIRSLAGWIYVSSRRGVEIGSRVEVEGVKGDVIDIGLLKTTLLEVGEPLVHGLQSTGRIVTVPNSLFLSGKVIASASINPLVWQEMQILVTFESDWKQARAIIQAVAEEQYEKLVPDLKAGFAKLERRFAFRLGSTAPIVYTEIADSGVLLTLRYLTPVRRRRSSVDFVSGRILEAFAQEPNVEFAYPTYRIYRMGEEARQEGASFLAPPGRTAE
jgi:small-conductance mechanosensitive channel